MIKRVLEAVIRKTKNDRFRFDDSIPFGAVVELVVTKIVSLLRGLWASCLSRSFTKIYLGRSVKIQHTRNIVFGDNVVIGDYARLSALGKGPLSIGDNVNIGAFSQVIISTSYNDIGEFIKIDDSVGFGEFAYLGGAGGLTIGKNTIIGQYFSAHPENHNFTNPKCLIRHQGVTRRGIKIGENCWIGSKVTILDGVTIGDNCVVAAGAVVNSSFPDNVVIGGVPAVALKRI
ncbi:acyltransferase [Pseudomonadales bacterium]|nr:acyltransferase [Pseudomonadales bacterium]